MTIRSFTWHPAVVSIVTLLGSSCGPWDRDLGQDYRYRLSMIAPVSQAARVVGGGGFQTNISGTVFDLEPEVLWITISCELTTPAQLRFDWKNIKIYGWNSETATKGEAIDFAFDYSDSGSLDVVGNRSMTRLSLAESVREQPLYFEIPVSAATGESVVFGFAGTPKSTELFSF